jgi:membrane protease YdiL (CAAX protease family)
MTKRADAKTADAGRTADRRAVWFEVAAIVALICVPEISAIASYMLWGPDYRKLERGAMTAESHSLTAFNAIAFDSMISRLRFVPIVLFVMWRSGRGWAEFGLVRPKFVRDLLLGLAFWLLTATLSALIEVAYGRRHPWEWLYPATIPSSLVLLIFGQYIVVGFVEELQMRAYLIPRLELLTASTWKAVLASLAIFAFLHGYQGYMGVVSALVSGGVFSAAFCLTRRIWPAAIAHSLGDFIIKTHLAASVLSLHAK